MSDHISIEVTDSGLGGYVELIRCPICAAALVDEDGEKAHLAWHANAVMQRFPLRYDADENTPYVDNAGTEELLDRLEEKVKAAICDRRASAWPFRMGFGGTGPDNCVVGFTDVPGIGWVPDDHYQNEMRRG